MTHKIVRTGYPWYSETAIETNSTEENEILELENNDEMFSIMFCMLVFPFAFNTLSSSTSILSILDASLVKIINKAFLESHSIQEIPPKSKNEVLANVLIFLIGYVGTKTLAGLLLWPPTKSAKLGYGLGWLFSWVSFGRKRGFVIYYN